jgi:hypothetical protein
MPGNADVESGVVPKDRREWLEEFEFEPVGGLPGNYRFGRQVLLGLRCSFFGVVLSSIVWFPAVGDNVPQDWKKYVAVGVMVIFFNLSFHFGSVVGAGSGAIQGTFYACFNIFMLRGFFPDGRTPEMGHMSTASVVGWLDLALFNMFFLSTDMRMGVKMFALANNTVFLLCFLNPADQTPFSKNFKINPNGTAVNCLKVAILSSIFACLANLLPIPEGFASVDMKVNARRVSAYMAKNFINSTVYYSGSKATVDIEKQMRSTELLQADVDSLGAVVGAAWYEGMDIGVRGTIRNLHDAHAGLVGDLMNTAKAMEIAIQTEDFGPSHQVLMDGIKEQAMNLCESTGELLCKVTSSAGDGNVDADENAMLGEIDERVANDIKSLGRAWNTVRQNYKCISQEALNESFFVFALSSYARKVREFSDKVRTNENLGSTWFQMVSSTFWSTFDPHGSMGDMAGPIAVRSWTALMLAFLYGVTIDNYTGACCVTIVFFLSLRSAPDIASSLKSLTASTIASVVAAIIFTRSCETGHGFWLLPLCSFIYWWGMMYLNFSGCNYAVIGLLAAALSPFTLVAVCPTEVNPNAAAAGLLISVRGFIMALFLMSCAEYLSAPDSLSKLAYESIDKAIHGIAAGVKCTWKNEDPLSALGPVSKALADAKTYGEAAREEPRMTYCPWKGDLCAEVGRWLGFMKLDLLTLHSAMCGADGETKAVFAVLNQCQAFGRMRDDFDGTLLMAQKICKELLMHQEGIFKGLGKLSELEGIEELEDYQDALAEINEIKEYIKFPSNDEIITIEDDLLCQISIIFVMMDYATKRIANVIGACVRLA